MKKVGLFFGSYNPIHIGHLIIANHIVEHTELDKVCFVISPQNPFKPKETLLQDYHRRALVNVAIEDNYKFYSSDIEFTLPKPSYTIHTLVHFRERYPDTEFYLIMGEDNLNTLHKWKNAEQIIRHHKIIVYPRFTDNAPERNHEFLKKAQVIYCDAPVMKISSSTIRGEIKNRRSVKYLLPEKVEKYVEEMHFYR